MTLKELRKSKGLSQEYVAKLVNIPLRTYKRIETDSKYSDSFKYKEIYEKLSQIEKISKNSFKKSSFSFAIAGIGYVGTSLAVMLSSNKLEVTLLDINKEKVDLINKKICPFKDELIGKYIGKCTSLSASVDVEAYKNKDVIIIATPTDYDDEKKTFNCSSVINVLDIVYKVNRSALVVVKSTIPIGFVDSICKQYPGLEIVFSPEFLREGKALYDNFYPTRIIIGCNKVTSKVKTYGSIIEKCSKNLNKVIYMSSREAEATKLFANAYLAMRVAYFNELDSYALENDLEVSNIIKGISLDPRIGDYYNNPSFGYGGYCLPKDSKMLSSSFTKISNNNLIKAILDSNKTRKEYIADKIIENAMEISNKPKEEITIGIYKLSMKKDSDNFRSSSTLDVLNILNAKNIKVVVFDEKYPGNVGDFDTFVAKSDLIISNRIDSKLKPYGKKVFTRDLYNRD